MKRSVRQASKIETIQVSSDSENESGVVSSDENYVPQKTTQKSKKKSTTTDNAIKNNKKRKANSISVPAKKQRLSTESENKNEEIDGPTGSKALEKRAKGKPRKKNVESVDKENIEQDLSWSKRFNSVECKDWTVVDYVSEMNNVDKRIAENVINLFDKENTIPFIARYRRNMIDNMEPDQLRALKESLEHAKAIKQRANTILKTIDKIGHWTPEIHSAVTSAKCLDDIEHIYSQFKPTSKRTLADKARELGLGLVSDLVLQGQPLPLLSSLIDPNKDSLKTEEKILEGITCIIADVINKDKTVFDKVRELQVESNIKIQSTECKANSKSSDNKKKDEQKKYETYYNFNSNTKFIKPYQILAMNRGEAQKILTVKICLPEFLENGFKRHCCKQYRAAMVASAVHCKILNSSINYTYTKFIKPLVIRRVRSEMKRKAETASIEVFVTNVKQLLLSPPVRGKIILGVDPGFTHGCKLAVISEQGDVLDTGIIYPHKKIENSYEESSKVLVHLVNKHSSTILALGNATACRETEVFLNKLISSKAFGSLDISYTIVDECGASIYSCSPEAKSEFPNLDPNFISAISIARRLQDPLAELVKLEPKNLGVGMYQHDLPEKQLSVALNEVISEAVSFVGVDVNTASQCLLKRVAGLNVSRASSIIEWRIEHGPFKNRQQLLDVKGIGNKVFEQCAGFIRILPENSANDNDSKKRKTVKKTSKHSYNLLDQTWIHPESYKVAEEFLEYCKCNLENLGTVQFIERIKSRAEEGCTILAKKFNTEETTMEVIIKGLSMRKDEDIRLKTRAPLFRKNMMNINDLVIGTSLTGAIRNITHFGAFVDVGVGKDGLIPTKWLKNITVSIGQRVEVRIMSVDADRGRIGLELINAF